MSSGLSEPLSSPFAVTPATQHLFLPVIYRSVALYLSYATLNALFLQIKKQTNPATTWASGGF